jgi:OFA family oxalate/formate antiporter-like MFS transporter
MIQADGYEATFLFFGLMQGIVVFILGWFLVAPGPGFKAAAASKAVSAAATPAREYAPLEMIRTPVFWVMYVMFVLMATGGLMATAQLAPIARDFQIADIPVSLLGITLPALTFALSIDRVLNGVTRPFFGWVSDRIGREQTMFIAFALEGIGILMLSAFGNDPVAFVLLTGLVFFAWGEIYSLFPATCADAYGRKYAAGNYGLLYTAKGTASLLVPVTSVMAASSGNWQTVFIAAAVMNLVAAFMALFVLKPLRLRMSTERRPAAVPVRA